VPLSGFSRYSGARFLLLLLLQLQLQQLLLLQFQYARLHIAKICRYECLAH